MLCLTIISSIAGNAIAWAFPQVQWLKRKARLDGEMIDLLYAHLERSTPLQRIHQLASTAVNCDSCCSFWACLAIGIPAIGLIALAVAPLAYTASAIINRIMQPE